MAYFINPITHETMAEISSLDISQIDPTEFANFNKMQLLAFTTEQLDAMNEEQRHAHTAANNEKPDLVMSFIGV